MFTDLPHSCSGCGVGLDHFGVHGLLCRMGKGCFSCHNSINNVIKLVMGSIKIPSQLELFVLTAKDLMVLQLSFGLMESPLLGMSHAPIPWSHHIDVLRFRIEELYG